MKKLLKNYLTKEVERYNSILEKNSLSDEDRVSIEAAIKSLQDTLEAVDATEDESVIDELKATVEALKESLIAIQEKINQNKEEINDETQMENYLETRNAYNDYAKLLKNSASVDSFNRAWKENLKSQNTIVVDSDSILAYMPAMVKGKIQDAWDRDAGWLKRLKIVNAKNYVVRYNPGNKFDTASRAAGWRPGCTKNEQELELVAKNLLPQMIYKIQSIDADMEFGDEDGSLLDYILDELTRQILFEIKIAILTGLNVGTDCGKIDAIEPIYKGETDAFTTVITATGELNNGEWENSFLLDELHNLVANVRKYSGEEVTVFIAESLISAATRVAASDTATPMYLDDETLARQLRASHIEVTDILDQAGIYAIAMVDKGYVLDLPNGFNPTLTRQIDIYNNTEVFREELRVKGLIEGLKSTAVLVNGNNGD